MPYLHDNTQAWQMDADGAYRLLAPEAGAAESAQQLLLEQLSQAQVQPV
jgi:hypothetical protein